jgi:hypothetical protein
MRIAMRGATSAPDRPGRSNGALEPGSASFRMRYSRAPTPVRATRIPAARPTVREIE